MKNLFFLINFLCIIALSSPATAAEQDVYALAKEAYRQNDCKNTIKLLRQFLNSKKPDKKKAASVYSVIGWCETYLSQGQATYYLNGHDGADEEITADTEFGKWMKSSQMPLR